MVENGIGGELLCGVGKAIDIVDVEHGGVDVKVPKHLLYLRNRCPGLQSKRGGGVTKRMRADPCRLQSRVFESGFDDARDRLR